MVTKVDFSATRRQVQPAPLFFSLGRFLVYLWLFSLLLARFISRSRCSLSAHARLRVLREGQSSVAFPIERVAASCGAILRKTLGRTRPQPNEPAPPD